ncbi:hypothetical protein K1T71_009053 [Dendrolimus kikuchii]|uniref:Uncharacterized protein n=1 Tax=Dendrolimus kikuchii TaxID=765133 RepID=A0ACC1CW11_9NEOP|nr:hypothetical protein K1T71_009053 [Dendrolimus kikuchii]
MEPNTSTLRLQQLRCHCMYTILLIRYDIDCMRVRLAARGAVDRRPPPPAAPLGRSSPAAPQGAGKRRDERSMKASERGLLSAAISHHLIAAPVRD